MTNKWDDLKKKGEQLVSDLEKNPKLQDVKQKALKNPKEVLLGALMVLGLLFSYYWFGSLVVGIAAGLFAPWTIKDIISKAEQFYKTAGNLPSFMLAATVVFLLFHVFWFVVGAVAAAAVKLFLDKPKI